MGDKSHGDDPNTFDEMMSDIDFEKQLDAMKLEIDSMHLNQVWTLVDLSEGIVPIRCKQIYKRKIDAYGKIEIYKARLMTKDYNYHESINHQEIFSSVAILKFIHTLLAIAAYYDYEI